MIFSIFKIQETLIKSVGSNINGKNFWKYVWFYFLCLMLHPFTFSVKFLAFGWMQHTYPAVFLEGWFASCTYRFEGFQFLEKRGKRKLANPLYFAGHLLETNALSGKWNNSWSDQKQRDYFFPEIKTQVFCLNIHERTREWDTPIFYKSVMLIFWEQVFTSKFFCCVDCYVDGLGIVAC